MLIIVYLGFVSLGIPDALYGVAWPSLRDCFALSERPFGLPLLATMSGFLLSSTQVGLLVRRIGLGPLLAASTGFVATGLIGFAVAPNFSVFVLSGVFVGLGSGAIDAGLNSFAAERYSARQMNWLHAAFGFGAAVSPFVMTFAVASSSWRVGYAAVATVMIGLTVLFSARRNAFRTLGETSIAPSSGYVTSAVRTEPAGAGAAVVQVALFALYAGTETAFGQLCFTVLSEIYEYPAATAGFLTGGFWLALFLGRVLLGAVSDQIGTDRMILGSLAGVVAGACVFTFAPAFAAPIGLLIVGASMAPVFPLLMHKTPRIFGHRAAKMVGLQVGAAMVGGVTVPTILGALADATGLGFVPFYLVVLALLLALLATASHVLTIKP